MPYLIIFNYCVHFIYTHINVHMCVCFCLKHVFTYICKICKCVCHRNIFQEKLASLVRWAAHEDPKLAKTLLCDSGVLCGIFVCFRGHLEKETLKLRCCWCRIDVSWSSVRKGRRFHDDSKKLWDVEVLRLLLGTLPFQNIVYQSSDLLTCHNS